MFRACCQNSPAVLAGRAGCRQPHGTAGSPTEPPARTPGAVEPWHGSRGALARLPGRSGGREKPVHTSSALPGTQGRQCLAGLAAEPHDERLRSAPVTTLPSHPAQHQRCPWGCLNHRCCTSIWRFAKRSVFNACLCSSSHFAEMTKPCTTPA